MLNILWLLYLVGEIKFPKFTTQGKVHFQQKHLHLPEEAFSEEQKVCADIVHIRYKDCWFIFEDRFSNVISCCSY